MNGSSTGTVEFGNSPISDVMSLITHFDPWKSNLCSCPAKYSLSAYTGCGHGCLYCYASSYIRNFSASRPKKDFLKRLDKEIKKIPQDSTITIANSSDPYLPLEKKLNLTQEMLKILKKYPVKINIVTKSSLILKDLEILKNIEKLTISFSITTLDEKLAKILEPGAPSPQDRLKAIEKLSQCIPLALRLDPLIYPLNIEKLKITIKTAARCGVKQIISSTYKAKPDSFKKMLKAFPEYTKLWNKLYFDKGEKKNRYLYLPSALRKELMETVKQIALSEKLEFTSCREGFNSLNTAICDGSSLFNAS